MRKLIFIFLLLIPIVGNAIKPAKTCRECILKFYNLFFLERTATIAELSNVHVIYSIEGTNSAVKKMFKEKGYIDNSKLNCESLTMKELLKNSDKYCQGYDKESVFKFINNAKIYNEGFLLDSIMELKFPNGNTIFYQINIDPPISINLIWLPGEDFLRPAIINDSDGYVNIRKEANANSKIVHKITTDKIFFFAQRSKSNWYPVYKTESSPCIGYIHKSKIRYYKDFSSKLQKKVTHMRSGC